ncbi:putative bifunctional diguanylate cyclase/phosphodiesterase [Halomonas stenophila]|nr:EAL domain-containing protein [Halomonas stenophila]
MQCERERQQQEIYKLAYRDPLTDLPNRRFLLHRLNQLVASTGGLPQAAVLFLDFNDFKLVNDALGHAAGDKILRRAARRIQHTLRDGDLLGRQGGDEFIVVMIDNPRDAQACEEDGMRRLVVGAEALAGRIVKALEQPFAIQGHRHHLSISIGISLLPCCTTVPEWVIDQADMAMYQAKKQGHQLAFYSPGMEQQRLQRLSLESRFYHALECEEFQLHYQPIWEIDSGRLVGVEALLRWTDAVGNRISPGEFIPIAEDLRLMGSLGDWVLKTAARQLVDWRARGITLSMAVNLSVSQLQGRQAAEHIRDQVVANGTQPEWWHLELTEETLMHEPEEVEEAMNVLSDWGFHLALDDFGRGYSSLARLQSMPLDILKIDKLFVDRLDGDSAGEPIVQAILDLARHLSIHVVAEGIETIAQRDRLWALGCHWGQGFLVSGARPADEIEQMIETEQTS